MMALFFSLAAQGFCSGDAIASAEGKIVHVFAGHETGSITILKEDGSKLELKVEPYRDMTPREMEAGVPEQAKKLPGKDFPSVIDAGCTVRAWYLPESKTLLKYNVISRPPELWIVIVKSTRNERDAQMEKYVAYARGFQVEVIESSHHDGLAPGLFAVVVGASQNREEALSILKKAREQGWKDAYVKAVRQH
jgi:hypothetical protein